LFFRAPVGEIVVAFDDIFVESNFR